MRRLGVGLLILLVTAATAFADKAARPAIAPADDIEAAKAHFAAGQAYYEQANYQDALREFSESFRLSNRTDLLYNIAVCQERVGRVDEAIASLRRYLSEKPNAPDRNLIEGRIASLDQQRRSPAVEPPPSPPTTVPAVPAVVEPKRPARWWVPGMAVGVGGAALLVAALGTGLASNALYNDLNSKCTNGMCPASLKNEGSTGRAEAIATDVLIGVGAAAVATSVIVLIVQSRRPSAKINASAGAVSVRF